MRRIAAVLAAVVALAFGARWILAERTDKPATAAPAATPNSEKLSNVEFRNRVVENIVSQPIGSHRVRDLALPREYLERLADHEIRWSYHLERHRLFRDVDDDSVPSPVELRPPEEPAKRIRVVRSRTAGPTLAYRRSFGPERPLLRGFRAPILEDSASRPPLALPAQAPESLRGAEATAAAELARTGLLRTLARSIATLGAERFVGADDRAPELLRNIGIPLDLLAAFEVGGESRTPARAIRWIARRLNDGTSLADLESDLAAAPFVFRSSRPGWRVATEGGEHGFGLIRLQLPKGTYWRGPGDGGAVDLARQVAEALPRVPLLVSVADEDLDPLQRTVASWDRPGGESITLVAEALPVSQWAQDNGKAGWFSSDEGRRLATIVPRYASRRNDASEFIPGDSYLADGLALAGHTVFQSPLAFQGGNLLAARDPSNGRRTLLISEAELHRNVVLGLTEAQVLEAFRIEFGVDRCVVLPLVSFHLDYDVSIRARDGRLVAFVNDQDDAVRRIFDIGLDVLARAGIVEGGLRLPDGAEAGPFVRRIGAIVRGKADRRGVYPLSLARHFSTGVTDSAIGNFQRFLVALETLEATLGLDGTAASDPASDEYLASIRRGALERRALHERLSALGFEVIPVPSLTAAELSVTYINGLHDEATLLMPAYGGLYEPLDRAATTAFREALGPDVRLVPILSAESQRRSGAVHCAAVGYPRL